jgi:hypothetical protein
MQNIMTKFVVLCRANFLLFFRAVQLPFRRQPAEEGHREFFQHRHSPLTLPAWLGVTSLI